MTFLNEDLLEKASIKILEELGFSYLDARAVAPGEPEAERADFAEVVLVRRLEAAIARLNPAASSEAREEALRKVLRVEGPSLVTANQNFHRMLSGGVPVEARLESGRIGGDHIRLADFLNLRMRRVKGQLSTAPSISSKPIKNRSRLSSSTTSFW